MDDHNNDPYHHPKGTEKEVNITHETLFEMLRREKTREELQKLSPTFFSDLMTYLYEKTEILQKQQRKTDLFSYDEHKKVEKQLDSVKRILEQFFERRERKILNMSLSQARMPSAVVSTHALLKEEKDLYDQVTSLLSSYRKGTIYGLLESTVLLGPASIVAPVEREPMRTTTPADPPQTQKTLDASADQGITKTVRFTHAIPKFMGADLEQYGPFEEEDVANLPGKIASVLIEKGRAEEMRIADDSSQE